MRVGLLLNQEKPEAAHLARQVAAWLAERGVDVLCTPEDAPRCGAGRALPTAAWGSPRADFAIALGGDGTLLKAARLLAPLEIPLLGVNLGRLGFLTEVEADHLFEVLPSFLEGRFVPDRRAMLEAAILRDGEPVQWFLALNDVVVATGPFKRLGRLAVDVSGSHLGTYPADGVIVATPTGSTAYSLAAGGPVINPDLDVLVITPICPHTFYARPAVISKEETVGIRVERSLEGPVVTLDGQERYRLAEGEEVRVTVSPVAACLMRRPGWDFYSVLRQKLRSV